MKSFRRVLIVLLLAFIAGVFYWHAVFDDRVIARDVTSNGQRVTLLSRAHTLDRIYMSMQGPFSNQAEIRLSKEGLPRELIWITGIRAELVGRDGSSPISREFFCHSNLTFSLNKLSSARTSKESEFTPTQDWRLFTLVPGRLELSLPEGFGLPVYSDEPLDYLSMSLNMNEKTGSRKVRFRTSVDFVRDQSIAKSKPMTPLFRRAIYGFEPIDRASPHTMCTGGNHPGAACGPFIGKAASNSFVASLGNTNTIHWMIPPGHYESRVPIDAQLDLPSDTTAHYVTGHLHPFGKSVALVDKTTKTTVFEIKSKDFRDKLGVEAMEEISSREGVQLFKDHTYELVTVYHNPTSEPIDAMSILYLYCRDKRFENAQRVTTVRTSD